MGTHTAPAMREARVADGLLLPPAADVARTRCEQQLRMGGPRLSLARASVLQKVSSSRIRAVVLVHHSTTA